MYYTIKINEEIVVITKQQDDDNTPADILRRAAKLWDDNKGQPSSYRKEQT